MGDHAQILQLSRKVWNSPTVRAELSKLSADANLNSDVLVRSVKTRWNTVTEVLARALDMRAVLGDLCDMVQFNKPRGVRLRQYILSDEEWTTIEQIYGLLDVSSTSGCTDCSSLMIPLQPFLYATKAISTSGRALVHQVIPYIDVLTRHVDAFAADETLTPAVRAAARRGRLILDKYYSLTDDSIVYRIAMSKHPLSCRLLHANGILLVLHPNYKMNYFRDQGWEEEWVSAAMELTRSEWAAYYRPAAQDDAEDAPAAAPAPAPAARNPAPGRHSAQRASRLVRRYVLPSRANHADIGTAALHSRAIRFDLQP